jgi:hypothetical protein
MKSNVTINPILSITATNYAVGADQYIAKKLFPVLPVGLQAAGYYLFKAENLLNVPALIARAPGTPYSRGRVSLDSDAYSTRDYGHEEPIDDRERKKYRTAFDAEKAAVIRAMRVIMVNQEVRAQALAVSAGVPTSAVGTAWDQANSDPIGDINAVLEVIRLNAGMLPNTWVITEPTFNVLREHAKVTDKIKYSQKGIITEDLLTQVFRIPQLLVARTVANSANAGQTLTPADIWGKDCIIAFVDASPDLQSPTFGRIFGWTEEGGPDGVVVESYRDDESRSDVVRVRNDADEKLVAPSCGYRLSGVIT